MGEKRVSVSECVIHPRCEKKSHRAHTHTSQNPFHPLILTSEVSLRCSVRSIYSYINNSERERAVVCQTPLSGLNRCMRFYTGGPRRALTGFCMSDGRLIWNTRRLKWTISKPAARRSSAAVLWSAPCLLGRGRKRHVRALVVSFSSAEV